MNFNKSVVPLKDICVCFLEDPHYKCKITTMKKKWITGVIKEKEPWL